MLMPQGALRSIFDQVCQEFEHSPHLGEVAALEPDHRTDTPSQKPHISYRGPWRWRVVAQLSRPRTLSCAEIASFGVVDDGVPLANDGGVETLEGVRRTKRSRSRDRGGLTR